MVSSPDLTYDKGYLSLLSNLGSLLAIITCSAPVVYGFFRKLWEESSIRRRVSLIVNFSNRSSLIDPRKRNSTFISRLRMLRRNKPAIAAEGKKDSQLDSDGQV